MTSAVSTTQLRTLFAERLSSLFGSEVPAYTDLVEASRQVNREVLSKGGDAAVRLGSIERVTAERHGAIRVGSPRELAQVARVFAAIGMEPVGFYDLRDAFPQPVPVVSTAFRPIASDELAVNPFRVFTSMLVPEDRRFFDEDLQVRLTASIEHRQLFPDELLSLADDAGRHGELSGADAERFLELSSKAFALSPEPVDRAWYEELERVSGVAADIGGVTTTHINHLTPRVLDIDELYRTMSDRGVAMIDEIQGPPRWEGPDVLLRQTSFRALSEPRMFREADGSIGPGSLRVRFGEVESRGIALTPAGRDLYDTMVAEVDRSLAELAALTRQECAVDVWRRNLPDSERGLWRQGLGYFTYVAGDRSAVPRGQHRTLEMLVDAGALAIEPIVYEDFLPRSAAGIFESNLDDRGSFDGAHGGAPRDVEWMAAAIDRQVWRPEELYEAQSATSLDGALTSLGVDALSE